MKTSNLLKEILDELNFRKAINPIVIEIAEISSITDYMVIASMDSDRGVKALADYVNEKLKKDFKIKTLIDGVNTSGWIIIDTGQIVTIDTPKALIKKLLDSGFEVEEKLQNATLEDVFINLTGKSLREN